MRWTVFCVLLIVTFVAAGCISGTGSEPSPGHPATPATVPSVVSGGRAIAIAVDADEITTPFPEAKALFIRGLTASSQYARYNESIGYFDAALAIDRNFTEAWYAKGVALHNLKRYDEAILCYDEALVIDPQNAAVWDLKGAALEDAGRRGEAAECYRAAAAIDPRYGTKTAMTEYPTAASS